MMRRYIAGQVQRVLSGVALTQGNCTGKVKVQLISPGAELFDQQAVVLHDQIRSDGFEFK